MEMDAEKNKITGVIDRTSPEPYYKQLLSLIETQIKTGSYKPGDRLPSETDLCRNFDLARSTVRETLRSLQDRGLIKIVPRRGAYVANPAPSGWLLQVQEGFFEEKVHHEHGQVETRVLRSQLANVPDEILTPLELAKDAPVYILERLRSLERFPKVKNRTQDKKCDGNKYPEQEQIVKPNETKNDLEGEIAVYSINYLLPELQNIVETSGVVLGRGSLNEVLRQAGYKIFYAHREVEAIAADENIASRLGVPVGTPLLLVTSISRDENNRPFDYYHAWLRSDVVKISVIAKAAES